MGVLASVFLEFYAFPTFFHNLPLCVMYFSNIFQVLFSGWVGELLVHGSAVGQKPEIESMHVFYGSDFLSSMASYSESNLIMVSSSFPRPSLKSSAEKQSKSFDIPIIVWNA